VNEVLQIIPLQGIPSGEHHDRGAHFPDVIQQFCSFLQTEFSRIPSVNGTGPAMLAGKCAGAGDFPDDQERGVMEVDIKGFFHSDAAGR
jgi:hypothetical protein